MFMDWKVQNCQCDNVFEIGLQIYCYINKKILECFFIEIGKLVLMFLWKY